jgi:hypothetical protein
MNNTITVYTPTGYSTNVELNSISQTKRNRVDYFDITGNLLAPSDSILTGRYYFSGYTQGFTGSNSSLSEQYALYTGIGQSNNQNLYCYYNTGATGFVFSTGKAFQNNTVYDKVITNTGLEDIFNISVITSEINNSSGFRYTTVGNKRSFPSGSMSGSFKFYQLEGYNGALLSEVEGANHPQITRFALSGYNNNIGFGSKVYISGGDINANLVSKIALGSPYRLERKNASDQIYKIISIRDVGKTMKKSNR